MVSERAEGDEQRHPSQHAPVAVATFSEPHDVGLDLSADPRGADPIDRGWFGEVLLQHGNFLSLVESEEEPCRRAQRYVPRRASVTSPIRSRRQLGRQWPQNATGNRISITSR